MRWLKIPYVVLLVFTINQQAQGLDPSSPDKLAIIEKLVEADFAVLDSYLLAIYDAYVNEELEEEALETAFLAFANSTPEYRNLLDDWVDSSPTTFVAYLARGVYAWNQAQNLRGAKTQAAFSDDHQRDIRHYLSLATEDFATALHHQPQLGLAYALLIDVATQFGERSDIETLHVLGIGNDPLSHNVHRRYLDSLKPWTLNNLDSEQEVATKIDAYLDRYDSRLNSKSSFAYLTSYRELFAGDAAARNGQRELAARHYQRAIDRAPGWIQYVRQGVNDYRLGTFQNAVDAFDKALEYRPQSAQILRLRARAQAKLRRTDLAKADLLLAGDLDPFSPPILLEIANSLRDERDFEGALAALNRALEFGAYSVHVWDARGRIYLYDIQNFERAVHDLHRAVLLAPSVPRYQFNYALAVYKSGQCEATEALQTYINLCGDTTCPVANVTSVQEWLGELLQAGRCLEFPHERRDHRD